MRKRSFLTLIAVVFGLASAWGLAGSLSSAGIEAALAEAGDTTRHFRVERPANLSDDDANAIYDRILDAMVEGYSLSGDATAAAYRRWRQFNSAPYRSAQHGERFVANYGNALAGDYWLYDKDLHLPEGAILAKDSFAVTAQGDVFSGPLFLMEKMAQGFSPESSDWRYTMIMPDGSLFGTTKGEGSARVEFCIGCHAEGGSSDHLFFIPEPFRLRPLSTN
jgi:hypothetical protein